MKVHRLVNGRGNSVSFIALGGVITAIEMPDRRGSRGNIVLAFGDLEAYETQRVYLGCIVGRYANRIAGARFSLDGLEYRLTATNGTSCVHGGRRGFDKAEWSVSQVTVQSATLAYRSPDNDEGFPGNLDVTVRYTLTDADELEIDYEAVTDAPTIVNLTNHSYFNLAGEGSGDILGHQLEVRARTYTPADSNLIPFGALAPVEGTPFDFRQPTAIGARIQTPHPQMIASMGYDVNYVIDRENQEGLALAARLSEAHSGRIMEELTTQPGLQLYTGNLLDGTIVGVGKRLYRQTDGVCLETHHYPDSPNKPSFPSTVLRPGNVYRSATVYRFAVAPR